MDEEAWFRVPTEITMFSILDHLPVFLSYVERPETQTPNMFIFTFSLVHLEPARLHTLATPHALAANVEVVRKREDNIITPFFRKRGSEHFCKSPSFTVNSEVYVQHNSKTLTFTWKWP